MQETQQQEKVALNNPNLETRKQKLERKRKRREMWYKSTPQPLILANLSVNHKDYGLSPAEHLRAKLMENNS